MAVSSSQVLTTNFSQRLGEKYTSLSEMEISGDKAENSDSELGGRQMVIMLLHIKKIFCDFSFAIF